MLERRSFRPAARRSCAAGFVVLGTLSCGRAAEAPPRTPTISFTTDASAPGFGDVVVHPLSASALRPAAMNTLAQSAPTAEQWQRVLSVHTGDSSGLAMLGAYSVSGDTLRFRPRFPPVPGLTYVARFDPGALDHAPGSVITATWTRPRVPGLSSTVVEAVYPSAHELPMNLLRMYVHFSAPMSTGKAFDHITLYTDRDSLVAEPFFTAGGMVELWDPDKKRLTILFDPGRIKRDLRPHEEMGLPLRSGHRYRLVIDSAWPDAQGRPLARPHAKRFTVGAQDRSLVRTSTWAVLAPTANTRDSLVLRFPEPLDRALLQRLLTVRDSSGAVVDGAVAIGRNETRWSFTPAQPWKPVAHFLVVDTELEDLAGNSVKKLFDVAPGDSAGVDAPAVRLRFVPR